VVCYFGSHNSSASWGSLCYMHGVEILWCSVTAYERLWHWHETGAAGLSFPAGLQCYCQGQSIPRYRLCPLFSYSSGYWHLITLYGFRFTIRHLSVPICQVDCDKNMGCCVINDGRLMCRRPQAAVCHSIAPRTLTSQSSS
jgi:hypothetical protein